MKPLIVIFLALFGTAVKAQLTSDEETDRDATATTPELIARANYSVEIHHVTTEDGYILEIHRIPGGPASPAAEDKPVVFLMHGILLDSSSWIILGPENALAYLLADAGYDVWMGNARGNTYSKNHTTITDLSSKEFWDFSWHEIGYYDLPATIDYILQSTGQKKLRYIGFSQGTTCFYVMASSRPEYNDKIEVMFSLAPVAYVAHVKSPVLNALSAIINSLTLIANLLDINEFAPNTKLFTKLEETTCNDDSIAKRLCSNLLFTVFGFDQNQVNDTQLPVFLGHFPAGSSSRQLIHYGQEIRSNRFRQYDHGLIKNEMVYGRLTPPNYKLNAITVPIYLFDAPNDWIAAPKDVEKLYSQLSNAVELFEVADDQWNHIDFVWGKNAKEYVYDPVLQRLEKYRKL